MTDASGADELRFAVHALFAMPDLVDPEHGVVSVTSHPSQTLRSTYYDSPDLRLAREGITLQHRSGDGAPTWTLQVATSAGSGPGRDEIHSPGSAREVPAELKNLLVAWLRGASLSPVATLRTQRALSILCGEAGEELGEVVDDSVSVLEGRRVLARFREVEVVAIGLAEPARLELRRRLVEAGASDADPLPQVVRALGPRAAAPGEVPLPTPVGPSDP